MSDEVKTFTIPLAGRDITFRQPILGQVIMLHRLASRSLRGAENAEGEFDAAKAADAMAKVLDFIETLVVSPDDVAFIETKMMEGQIDYPDLLVALSGGKGTPDADDAPPANRAAKRATAKKATKKAVSARAKR